MSPPGITVRRRLPERPAKAGFFRTLRARLRREARRLSTTQWIVVFLCITLPPLFALGFFSSPRSEGAAAAGLVEAARGSEEARPSGDSPEDLVDPLVPGDFLSDLERAISDGESSGLVHLAGEGEEAFFDRLREATVGPRGLNGMRLFRMDRRKDGVEVYRVEAGQAGTPGVLPLGILPLGILMVKQIEGRWHIVGAGEAQRTGADPAEADSSSARQTISSLSSMLDHPDEDVRRAAAEALELMRKEQLKGPGSASGSWSTPRTR